MGTIIFPVNPVDVDVLLECNELVEFDPTDRTVVRSFFRGVDLNVTRQGGVGQESLSAVCAGQRFGLVRAVNSHMFLQMNTFALLTCSGFHFRSPWIGEGDLTLDPF